MVPSGSVSGPGESCSARTPKANESVKLIFDYVDSQRVVGEGDEQESGGGESGGGGSVGGADDRNRSGNRVRGDSEKDPAFKGRRKTKMKMSLLRFGKSNKKALYSKPKSQGLVSPATQTETPIDNSNSATPRGSGSRRSVYGDNFNKQMPHIGETLLEHQRRTLVPKLRDIADRENTRVADNASTLISDAMHLRNVNAHRWNKFSLRFYKARNSRAYHVLGFMVIMAHTVLSMFESPREEWEHVTDYLKFANEAVQKNVCSWANYIFVTIYLLDIVVQLCYQRIAWHDVDWASDYVKNRGGKNVESTARSFRKHFVSSLRESSFGGGAESERPRGSFSTWLANKISEIMMLKYNFIFIFNFLVVAFMIYATATKLPSKGAFFRPAMFLFTNYRIQTACGAFVKMLPHLTDILVILFLFIVVFAAITCVAFEEAPSASSNPEEGFSSFWYALLNYYVLLSTENFPSILDRFQDNFVAWVFIFFLVIGYFIFMAYMTAIVFDGYYHVKIQISLQEYLTERSALVTAFLCIAYDPLADGFNEVLTLGDLIEANLTFHGKNAGIEMITDLFLALDVDGSKTLDEEEFYHFCDGVVSLLERLENQDLEFESLDHRSTSGSFDIDNQGRTSFSSEDGQQRRRSSSFNPVSGAGGGVRRMVWNLRKFLRRMKLHFIDFFRRHVDKLIPEEGTHILFNHILQIFRSGLIQIFFILALVWTFAFSVIAMNVLGKQECINKAVEALGEDVDVYQIPYYERFDTFPNSMVAMFRLATGSGWNDVMFLYWPCESPWGGTNFSPVFFVTFHFSFCIAKELLGTNPYASRTLIDMANRLLAPASGLQWDMTVINSKHAMRSDSGTHESDSRVRASSVGTEADSPMPLSPTRESSRARVSTKRYNELENRPPSVVNRGHRGSTAQRKYRKEWSQEWYHEKGGKEAAKERNKATQAKLQTHKFEIAKGASSTIENMTQAELTVKILENVHTRVDAFLSSVPVAKKLKGTGDWAIHISAMQEHRVEEGEWYTNFFKYAAEPKDGGSWTTSDNARLKGQMIADPILLTIDGGNSAFECNVAEEGAIDYIYNKLQVPITNDLAAAKNGKSKGGAQEVYQYPGGVFYSSAWGERAEDRKKRYERKTSHQRALA
ncbi:hypothetical protein TrRE_jg2095 [Triparma retinervis]|uniref:EF-hand domain-containing protein n=1 Tax=Triparma retinervis TaxID=2557542 RepID=A0A9W6ZY35_9STRA|nr:hypothetical protein TrRE_jg2095 [Triparma retinervis]